MNAPTYPFPENTLFDAAIHGSRATDHTASNAAFFSASSISMLRIFNRVLCRVSPASAAIFARRMIGTPPRHAPRTWEVALLAKARSFSLPVGARTIPVAVWGQGATVVLVHSWGGRGTQMGKFVEPLVCAGFRVVSFDLPAHGQAGAGETDMVECAAAVAAVLRQQIQTGQAPIAVIAHSFGVMAGLLAASEHEIHIPNLVSIGAFDHCRWFIDQAQRFLNLSDDVATRDRDNFEARYAHRITWDRLSVVEMLRASRARTLVIHDRFDREIPYEHSYALRSVSTPKQPVEYFPTVGLGHRRILADASVISRAVAHVQNAKIIA